MPVDLHTHSSCSDGSDSPEELIANAAAAGATTIALTDHDNLNGIDRARAAAGAHGIELIPGTELSVRWERGAMHLLVYFLEPATGPLQDRLAQLQDGRADRNLRVVRALQDLGIDITYDEVEREAQGQGIGRPHIAAVLMAKGVVPDIAAAFDAYLAKGRPAYQERYRLDFVEAVELARASEAVPVIAHPHTIGVSADDYGAALRYGASIGVMGIEAHYSEYSPDTRAALAALADDLGVVATGGSDYHGTYKPDIDLVVGRGDLAVPEAVVDRLAEAQRTLE